LDLDMVEQASGLLTLIRYVPVVCLKDSRQSCLSII
jgi:hypothetical protein